MLYRSTVRLVPVLVFGLCAVVSGATKAQQIGRVTAAFGVASADTAAGARPLDIQSPIHNDERIVTNGGGLSILLSSRVVVKVDVESAISILEEPAQTTILLHHGTAHIFAGQRPSGAVRVCLQDPNGCVETPSGVFLAHHNPLTKESFYATEHSTANVLAGHHGEPVTLNGDQQAITRDGKLVSTGDLDRIVFNKYKKSLDRLAMAQVKGGAQTFRLRSRALDTDRAIAALSAAGWIDRNTLPGTSGSSDSNSRSAPGEVTVGDGEAQTQSVKQPAAEETATANADASPAQAAVVAPKAEPPVTEIAKIDLEPPTIERGKIDLDPPADSDRGGRKGPRHDLVKEIAKQIEKLENHKHDSPKVDLPVSPPVTDAAPPKIDIAKDVAPPRLDLDPPTEIVPPKIDLVLVKPSPGIIDVVKPTPAPTPVVAPPVVAPPVTAPPTIVATPVVAPPAIVAPPVVAVPPVQIAAPLPVIDITPAPVVPPAIVAPTPVIAPPTVVAPPSIVAPMPVILPPIEVAPTLPPTETLLPVAPVADLTNIATDTLKDAAKLARDATDVAKSTGKAADD